MKKNKNFNNFLLILISAVFTNSITGLLYVWSLFIIPIERFLNLTRSDLGLISSFALIGFTIGVSILPIILKKIDKSFVSSLAFLLISLGHMIFGLFPSLLSLFVGYGVCFGVGSGLAYGLALYLTASLEKRLRAISIGIALGAFALSGILLPIILGDWISNTNPDISFVWIGLASLFIGTLSVMFINLTKIKISGTEFNPLIEKIPIDTKFLMLCLIFFLVCFTGLAIVSQSAAIASSAEIETSGYAISILTVGYLIGCLTGAPFAENVKERVVLLTLSFITLIGVVCMLSNSFYILFLGSSFIGLTLGGVGSVMPVLLGIRYGPNNISRLYGRMIIAYGLAGLIAPIVAGSFFDLVNNYSLILYLCIFLSIFSAIISILLKKN